MASRSPDPIRGTGLVAGFIYQHLMRHLFRLNVRGVECDYRLFRRDLLVRVQFTCNSGVICVEMMKKLQEMGCRTIEVPVHHYHRYSGSSQFFRFKHLRRVFIQLFTAWWKLEVCRERVRGSPMPKLETEL